MSGMSDLAAELNLFHTGNLTNDQSSRLADELTKLGSTDLLDAELWWAINGQPEPWLFELKPPGHMPPPTGPSRRPA